MKSYRKELWFEIPARRGVRQHHARRSRRACRERRPRGAVPGQRHAHHRVGLHQRRRARPAPRLRALAREAGAARARSPRYRHNRTGEDNADAHLKRQIMGREVVVAVTDGQLDFGPWEQIFYGEFDGRRRKRVLVKIIGE